MSDPPILIKIPNYVTYLCFTLDTTDEQARNLFVRRFGREPQELTRDNNMVWAGPAPERKVHNVTTDTNSN